MLYSLPPEDKFLHKLWRLPGADSTNALAQRLLASPDAASRLQLLGEGALEYRAPDGPNPAAWTATDAAGLEGRLHGTAIMADEQRAGRGQEGASWYSETGANLNFSLMLQPAFLPARDAFRLNVALSLGVLDVLRAEAPADWKLKWPNDCLAGGRKVGGILIQGSVLGRQMGATVFGLGLNANNRHFPSGLPQAASLWQLDGRERGLSALALSLMHALEERYAVLRAGAWSSLKRQYLQNLYGYGELLTFRSGEERFKAVVAGVEDSGELALQCGSQLRRFRFREIALEP